MNGSDYEKDILLVEDDDDEESGGGGFDYNETKRIPKILTEEDIKKLKAAQKMQKKD